MAKRRNRGFDLIDNDDAFVELVDRLADEPIYAVDTEFHRERTYFPHVALVQIADSHGVSLVDALSVDLSALRKVLEGPGLAVMHAARQDMEVLERACGTIPTSLVDTQLQAGFLGYTSPSLATLLDKELDVRVPKADRLTDWLRRPLGSTQLEYAASDVAHLLKLHAGLRAKLSEMGRLEWVADACEELRTEPRGARNPADAWTRIKEIRHLRGESLAVAQSVAKWREERAIDTDQTPRFILSDLGVVGVANSMPTTVEQLRSLRGIEGRNLRSVHAEELLSVVRSAKGTSPLKPTNSHVPELPSELKPAVPLISAWVTQRARELNLETSLLATRADLEALLRGVPGARLSEGWRAGVVGEPIRKLLSGEAALGFDRATGLKLLDQR
ncbi:MAG: ribonuclease D [Microthrixaceae bacterium]|nr:ribonuclease D [Microthrixaceae bacterium]